MLEGGPQADFGEQGTGSVHGLTLYISSGVRHVSECFILYAPYSMLCRPCRAIWDM